MSSTSLFHSASFTASLAATALFGSLATTPVLSHAAVPSAFHRQVSSAQASEDLSINREAVLGVAFLGSAAIGMSLTAIQERHRPARPTSSGDNFYSANPRLQQQLLRLLHEDRGAAVRLMSQAQQKYPGRSPNWYIEKVIYDLERDRGRV